MFIVIRYDVQFSNKYSRYKHIRGISKLYSMRNVSAFKYSILVLFSINKFNFIFMQYSHKEKRLKAHHLKLAYILHHANTQVVFIPH